MTEPVQPVPVQAVRAALPDLSGAARRVAEAILEDPDAISRMAITELARRADTSAATVTRFARGIGYQGFPDLKFALAAEGGRLAEAGWQRDIGPGIAIDDPPERLLHVLGVSQTQAIRECAELLDLRAVSEVASRISAASRVVVHGDWGDAPAALELQMRLYRIGVPAWWHSSVMAGRMGSGLLGRGDVALVLSHRGADPVARRLLRRARNRGATTVAITWSAESPLAADADFLLATGGGTGEEWTNVFGERAGLSLATGLLFLRVAQSAPEQLAHAFTAIYDDEPDLDDEEF